jgi:hypothetical protein
MADWKNAADYKFADAGRPGRWVWEFMRRNAVYRADFASVPALTTKQHHKYTKAGFSGATPLFTPDKGLGAKWQIDGVIQDPADDAVPVFRFSIPDAPLLNGLEKYYEEPDGSGQAEPRRFCCVLVFRLDQDLDMQLDAADRGLRYLQKKRGYRLKRRNLWRLVFATYLRVLDAKAAPAKTKEIVTTIAAYESVAKKTDADWEYQAQKRINKDLRKAKKLVKNPWSILFEQTSPISGG